MVADLETNTESGHSSTLLGHVKPRTWYEGIPGQHCPAPIAPALQDGGEGLSGRDGRTLAQRLELDGTSGELGSSVTTWLEPNLKDGAPVHGGS